MASFSSTIPKSKKLSIFLNISFLLLSCFCLGIYLYTDSNILSKSINTRSTSRILVHSDILKELSSECSELHDHDDYKSKCMYVKFQDGCQSKGFISYLELFYCSCGQYPVLGYAGLVLWLSILFYVLGNTAAHYFCPSLESLSSLLKLPPTIAGITLLSLGNGAPDVFASIVSFTKSANGDLGLNSTLGGAFFVSSVVVGTISVLIGPKEIMVDKASFVRDVLFFMFSLSSLLIIFLIGKISLWGAIFFVCIYFIYVCTVSAPYFFSVDGRSRTYQSTVLSAPKSCYSRVDADIGDVSAPLLGCVDDDDKVSSAGKTLSTPADHQYHQEDCPNLFNYNLCFGLNLCSIFQVLELPLYLPRRLTIPVVSNKRWSKACAVISVTLAPILLAALWNIEREKSSIKSNVIAYFVGGIIGIVLGNLAYLTTKSSTPPEKCLFLWLAGGFTMSITWTYITAQELVSLLVSLGHILGISPSVLGLTVLAWGNSLGDLIANVAMGVHGGPNGAQIAIAGCYAGPMFNTLIGLGMSFVFSSVSVYPSPYVIPKDTSLYVSLLFLMGALLWALVMLPKKGMKLDRSLGFGLLAIYFCFLTLRLAMEMGLVNSNT